MMTIVQKPSSINLSGNLPEFILFSDNPLNFVLKIEDNDLFSGTYTPGNDRKITINVKEVIESVLSFQFRNILETYTQDTLVGNFTAYINDEIIADFRVIKGGVSNFGMTAETFLQQHFLTWQPRKKKVSYSSPEYLSYYAITDCRVKLKAYISNTSSDSVETIEFVLAELKAGNVYTIPMMYAYISGKLNKYPSSYDVWIESTDGSVRYSYIQRYEYEQTKSEQEEFIIFENSLGGVDCFRAYGNTVFNAENTHNIATINEQLNEYRIDTEYKYTKNTGYLNQYEQKWLKDFFPSTGKYIFKDNILRKIVITDDNVSSSEQDAVGSYEFTYRYADDNIYLNLPIYQNSNTLISPMSIQSDNIDVIPELEPRMAEFPMQELSDGSLFPVQEPFSERWHATNAGAIANYIIEKINQLTDGHLLDNRFKGYFLTETSLKNTYPNPLYGESAWVGVPFPGVVYTVENGQWKTSGKAPEFGDISLEDYATKEELSETNNYTKKITTEYNVSTFHPTSGISGGNKYDLSTAIGQVPAELRTVGVKVSFINSTGKPESWKYQGGSWEVASFIQESGGGNKILEWTGDVSTTRKQVAASERKSGMQISYKPTDSDWVNEQYIGTSTDDGSWGNNINWKQIQEQKNHTIIIDKSFFTNIGYIDPSGTYKNDSRLKVTDYIPVSEGMRIICNYRLNQYYNISLIAAYSEDKVYIPSESSQSSGVSYNYTAIKTAKFVRISGIAADDDSVVISGTDNRLYEYVYQFKKNDIVLPLEDSINSIKNFFKSDKVYEEYELSDYSTITKPTSGYGYKNTTINSDFVINKIHVIPSSATVNIYINGNLIHTLEGLDVGVMNECDVNILVRKNDFITFSSIYYLINNGSFFQFCKSDGSDLLTGYLSYWIEYSVVTFERIENIYENMQYSQSQIGTNTAIAKHWDAGEDETGLMSNGFTKDETGLLLSSTATSFSYTRLSVQTIYLKFKVTSESEFKVRSAANDNEPGCTISFANGKITDLKNPENTVDIPSDFLVADTDNDVCVNFIENNEKHKIILSCDKTSSVVELELTDDIYVDHRVINVLVVAGTVYLVSYRLILPTDLDIIFTGDSITEGVGTDKTYAMLFKEKTGLKVATYALGGSTLGSVGSECVELCAPLKPKVISAMFGMNGGNSLNTFRRHQEICDRYFVAYVVQHMPMPKTDTQYQQQTSVIEQFLNGYAHIKYSARFDIATANNGNPDDGYNHTYGDGKHPNTEGHVKMYNRLLIDTPALLV